MKTLINFDPLTKKEINWRVFFMTFTSIFIIVSLQLLGVRSPRILNFESKKINASETIQSKLEKPVNNFQLKEENISYVPIDARAYALIDFDNGNIIAEKNSSERLAIASLTKIMTAVVALDLASSKDLFTVSKKASLQIPTKIGVVPNQKMTLEELLNALLLTSANDAAEVIREGIELKYGKIFFIQAMNEKAKFLGLQNTHFTNPQGFDSYHNYSTAKDLAILAHYAIENYPFIAQIVRKDYQFIPQNQNHKKFDLYNWNGLLGVYPNILGIKIGNTNTALETMIALSERQGKKIMAVLLGASNIIERDLWTADLLNFGFAKSIGLPPINITEQMLMEKYNTWQYGV